MVRPRTDVDEDNILAAHRKGTSLSAIAIDHDISRDIVRRVIREAGEATVLAFPHSYAPTAPEGEVTSNELIQRSGISYRQLDHWTRTGRLHASTAAEPGSGNARFYPASEIAVARLIKRLLDAGMQITVAHGLARDLSTTGTALLGGIRIYLPEEL